MRQYFMAILHLNRNVRLLMLAWGIVCFGWVGIIPVLQNLYLLRLGFGPEFIGLLTGMGQLVWGVSALPAGEFGRRFGARTALLCGFTLHAIIYTLFLSVEALPKDWWAPWLMVCWAIVWVGAAFNAVNVVPFLMAAAAEQERHYAFGAHQAFTALMAFLGSLTAGASVAWLAGLFGPADPVAPYRYTLWICFVANWTVIPLLLQTRLPPPVGAHSQAAGDGRVPWGLFAMLVLAVLFSNVADGSARTFFNVFLDKEMGVATAQIGVAFGLAQLLGVGVALSAPVLMSRLGAGRSAALAVLGIGLAVVTIALAPQWQLAAAGYVIVVAFAGLNVPSRRLFSQEITPPRWRPIASGTLALGGAIGTGGAAAVGGYLIGIIGFNGMFLTAASVSVLAVPVILALVAQHGPRVAPASAPAPAAK